MTDANAPEPATRRAIPKRLRFEILRRDGHACRYCGAMAPDVKLTVDHVIPVVLGGSDDPSNLVTACADCNAGKTSIHPGADIVEDVATDALRWAKAMESATTARLAEREVLDSMIEQFIEKWNSYTRTRHVEGEVIPVPLTGDPLIDNWRRIVGSYASNWCRPVSFDAGILTIQVERGWAKEVRGELNRVGKRREFAELLGSEIDRIEIAAGWDGPLPVPTRAPATTEEIYYLAPGDWRQSVERFISLGLPMSEILRLLGLAMETSHVGADDKFRWFCGCCWRAITDLQEDARRILEAGE